MTEVGRKPAGTGPPVAAVVGVAVGLTAGAEVADVGAELWLAGADGVDAAEAGGATTPELIAAGLLACVAP